MIGGEHYFAPPRLVENSMSDMLDGQIGATSFFSTGRDALFSLLKALPQRQIYLPDLICHSVFDACRFAAKEVKFYKIGRDLLHSELPGNQDTFDSCLLVMHYFGNANDCLIKQARARGMTVISDVTHMLFNRVQVQFLSDASDYLVASLRKSGPFPDGGFLLSRCHPPVHATRQIREDFFSLRAAGLLSRGFSARNNFCDDENFGLLRKAEELIDNSPPGDYQCSYLSRALLCTISVDAAATQISRNIAILYERLEGVCQTINNPASPSPYFVCIFKNLQERDTVRISLTNRRFFCPIHWDTSRMPDPSLISELVLSIPCDARYNEEDMQSAAKVIVSCLKS